MKDTKWVWFQFSASDAPAVERRMNALAQKGWELDESADCECILTKWKPTSRKDLQYAVLPALTLSEESALRQEVQHQRDLGWEPVATINGLNIYRSIPCFDVAYDESRHVYGGKTASIEFFRSAAWLLGVAAMFLLFLRIEDWYLSNFRTLLHFTAVPFLLAGGVYLAALCVTILDGKRPHPVMMWVKSAIQCLELLWFLLLGGCCLMDSLSLTLAVLVFALCLGGVVFCQLKYSRSNPQLERLVISVLLCAAIVLALPNGIMSDICPPHQEPLPTLTTKALGLTGETLDYTAIETTGSVLVKRTSYGEVWSDDLCLSENVYRCANERMARYVAEDLLSDQYTEAQDIWYSVDGSRIIARQGDAVLELWVSGVDLRSESMTKAVNDYLNQIQ